MKKTQLVLFAGGSSSEHPISLISARSIQKVLITDTYDIHIIAIDTAGLWWHYPDGIFTNGCEGADTIALSPTNRFEVSLIVRKGKTRLISQARDIEVDVALPILHGPGGEDGKLQGFLDTIGLTYIGCGVDASVIAMDKELTKNVLATAGIAVADGLVVLKGEDIPRFDDLAAQLTLPLFIKPARQGSSVGINKVENQEGLDAALKEAFSWDRKVLIEGCIKGREIECAVLGTNNPTASPLGEIIVADTFYDFESKYLNAANAQLSIPAVLDAPLTAKIQACACNAFKAIGAEGLSRIDFFVREDGTFLINEINTMPGFTPISMYAKLWEAQGLSYGDLVEKLIGFAWERA